VAMLVNGIYHTEGFLILTPALYHKNIIQINNCAGTPGPPALET